MKKDNIQKDIFWYIVLIVLGVFFTVHLGIFAAIVSGVASTMLYKCNSNFTKL